MDFTQSTRERARCILIGVNTAERPQDYARSMRELTRLARACDLEVVRQIVQNTDALTHATMIGSGKVEEIRQEISWCDADLVVFNEALTPMQARNLESAWDTEVLDRTGIILQIFSTRARTREARLQVEYAQLQYLLPRLAGMHRELSRQGGGSGRLSNKGAGEQKIELDRRRIEHRITALRRQLGEVSRERQTQRGKRSRAGLLRIALVGYTNAGKSTLMNHLLVYGTEQEQDERQVFEEDMLFATLDTTVRRIDVPGHLPFLLSDTVGFVSRLPHSLVEAFHSTLEEVREADLLLEVIDFSDPDCEEEMRVTERTLQEIGAGDIPLIHVYNKADLAQEAAEDPVIAAADVTWGKRSTAKLPERRLPPALPFVREAGVNSASGEPSQIYMSAKQDIGMEELLSLIDHTLRHLQAEVTLLIPYTRGDILAGLRQSAVLLSEEYLPEGTRVRVRCRREEAERLAQYLD